MLAIILSVSRHNDLCLSPLLSSNSVGKGIERISRVNNAQRFNGDGVWSLWSDLVTLLGGLFINMLEDLIREIEVNFENMMVFLIY